MGAGVSRIGSDVSFRLSVVADVRGARAGAFPAAFGDGAAVGLAGGMERGAEMCGVDERLGSCAVVTPEVVFLLVPGFEDIGVELEDEVEEIDDRHGMEEGPGIDRASSRGHEPSHSVSATASRT